jgi:eukaryotic-like serine/threonine-protein kinase
MIIVSNLTFEKIRQIGVGQGLNSTVWLANDRQFDCELAVKEIDKTTFWNPNCFAEAQAVYAVSHPNVVGVQYGSEQGNYAYIAMPYYSNGSLSDLLANGPLPLSNVLTLAQEVLLGLGHIHSKGFVHLDIKPSNIFFDHLHRALIADFGQSRQISSTGTVSSPMMYFKTMPPEVLQSGRAAAVSDIYHVWALLYRTLNGEEEWQRQLARFPTDLELQDAIKRGKFPDRDKFLPHVPKRLRTAIRKALDVQPINRFGTASAFAAELGRVRIEHDWNVTLHPSGEIDWNCPGIGSRDIEVELKQNGSGWEVRAYTLNAGARRAKGKTSLWEKFTSREAALKKLKLIFEEL